MNPEYLALGALIAGLLLTFYALRTQVNANVIEDVGALKTKLAAQEVQIHFLLGKVSELTAEIDRLRSIIDMQENDKKSLQRKLQHYQGLVNLNSVTNNED